MRPWAAAGSMRLRPLELPWVRPWREQVRAQVPAQLAQRQQSHGLVRWEQPEAQWKRRATVRLALMPMPARLVRTAAHCAKTMGWQWALMQRRRRQGCRGCPSSPELRLPLMLKLRLRQGCHLSRAPLGQT